MKRQAIAASLLGLALLLASPGAAHVTATPNEGVAGSYMRASFAVTHGCDGKPTVAVRIVLPEDVVVARPQAKPGWRIEIRRAALARPVPAGHGRMATERVAEIEWSGGRLDDAHYDEFGLSLKLPDVGDRMLWFKVTQVCDGAEVEWSQIPGPGERWGALPSPAPYIILRPPPRAKADEGEHSHRH